MSRPQRSRSALSVDVVRSTAMADLAVDDLGEASDRILFWTRAQGGRPQDFVRPDIPNTARQIVAVALSAGRDAHPEFQAMGWANCRICRRQLGTRDLSGLGLTWPEGAEHYVLEHGVWTPGCSELLSRIVGTLAQTQPCFARNAANINDAVEARGRTLHPLTPDVIAAQPDLDPWQRDELILQRNGEGWIDFEGNHQPARLIRRVCRPGDALYYWDGPWGVLSGSRGIAIVREGRVIETFTTVMS
jgi:hypothetical protein